MMGAGVNSFVLQFSSVLYHTFLKSNVGRGENTSGPMEAEDKNNEIERRVKTERGSAEPAEARSFLIRSISPRSSEHHQSSKFQLSLNQG